MRGVVIGICLLLFINQHANAQLPAKPKAELEALLQQAIPAERKIQVLLQLTLYYYFELN